MRFTLTLIGYAYVFLFSSLTQANSPSLNQLVDHQIEFEDARILSILDPTRQGNQNERYPSNKWIIYEARFHESLQRFKEFEQQRLESLDIAKFACLSDEQIQDRLFTIKERFTELWGPIEKSKASLNRKVTDESLAELVGLLEEAILLSEARLKKVHLSRRLVEQLNRYDDNVYASVMFTVGPATIVGGVTLTLDSLNHSSQAGFIAGTALFLTSSPLTFGAASVTSRLMDRYVYWRWNNSRLKRFIGDLARGLGHLDEEPLEQVRWFFQTYFLLKAEKAKKDCLVFLREDDSFYL
ncbi:MAG: hypothetical protein AB7F43_07385 [Bacteriovoracia bacterium]